MAFGDFIQMAEDTGTGVSTDTIAFSAATAGNLLIVMAAISTADTWGTAPTGYTLLTQVPNGSGTMTSIWYYKIAAGGETGATVAWSGVQTYRLGMAEFEGAFDATPLDVTAEDETNISTAVTSQPSGTTATTAQNDALALAFFGGERGDFISNATAYTNSFTERAFYDGPTSPGRPGLAIASRVLSATGTYTTTFSCTDTGTPMYGAIAVFKKYVAAGGPTPRLSLLGVG
jgi:hypothetical protein